MGEVPATRKLWAAASVAVCVVAFSGCKGCDEGLLDVDGVKVTGPAEVDPGAPVVYAVTGGIGKKPTKRKCPRTVQMSWQELDARGRPLDVPGASKGKITDITVKRSEFKYSKAKGCLLRKPGIKIPVNISPGRTDQHKVKLTFSVHGPPLKALPEDDDPLRRLAKVFALLSLGEETKIVTVKGVPQPVNAPPVAAFITSQSPAKTGAPLGLDARQSTDDVSIVRYEWDLDGNGTYEKTSASPTGVGVSSARAGSQPVKLRVTDNRGEQGMSNAVFVPSMATDVYYDGAPTLSPETTGPGKPVNVSVRRTSPSEAYRADLFCDTTLTSAVVTPTEQAFPQPCTFATAGFKTVAVRYLSAPGNTIKPTTFYRLAQIVPGARTSARVAATATPLSVPLTLSGATIKRLGRLRLKSTSGTIRGLIATGSGRGKVPKQTPRRFRSALRTLASGRFAVKFSGSAKLQSTTINLSGSATMLVRSRRSRKTQICLSVKAAGGGGPARFSVRGATGKARGFAATGTGPPISFDKATGRGATVTLAPRKGKARRLSATCRTLSRVLDGKKLKSKKRKR